MYAVRYLIKLDDKIISAKLVDVMAEQMRESDLFSEKDKEQYIPVIADCCQTEFLSIGTEKKNYINREVLIYDKIAAQAFFDGLKKLIEEDNWPNKAALEGGSLEDW